MGVFSALLITTRGKFFQTMQQRPVLGNADLRCVDQHAGQFSPGGIPVGWLESEVSGRNESGT